MPSDMPKLPSIMQAISPGPSSAAHEMALCEMAVPDPQAGEVLIKVHAAGVNRPDVFQRQGRYPPPAGASPVLGLEIAGTIAAFGPDQTTERSTSHALAGYMPAIGDSVLALVPGGGYAQYCTAARALLLPLPKGFDFIQAAAIPETFFTVWSNVFDRLKLQAGEDFLVHGGSSGIGITAIQLAHHFGARVFTTAGSAEKCHSVRGLGADYAFNYREQNFEDEILSVTEGKGVEAILDMVGGAYIARNWKAAAIGGRICQIANLGGPAEKVDFNRLMVKRLIHTGSTLRARDIPFKAEIAAALYEKVWPLLERGIIKIVIDSTYNLSDAGAAHARMESSAHIGKIMLTIS